MASAFEGSYTTDEQLNKLVSPTYIIYVSVISLCYHRQVTALLLRDLMSLSKIKITNVTKTTVALQNLMYPPPSHHKILERTLCYCCSLCCVACLFFVHAQVAVSDCCIHSLFSLFISTLTRPRVKVLSMSVLF